MRFSGIMIGSENPTVLGEFYIRVLGKSSQQDVQQAFTALKGLGATVVAEPYKPGGDDGEIWLATVEDPDGNYVQLARPWK